MPIFTDAHVVVLTGDYLAVDGGGKLNGLGISVMALGRDETSGASPPMYVAVMIDLPSRYAGDEYALSVELRNETRNEPVQFAGQSGQLEALRIQQVGRVERPSIPNVYLPPDMFSRSQLVLGFPNGLPVEPGHKYAWRVQIDGQSRPGWKASFQVLGPPPAPIFGGPVGPANIPNIAPPDDPVE